jgi:hypothetical protein
MLTNGRDADLRLRGLARSQVDRLTYIDFRLYFLGELRRADIIERFQTGSAGATRDVALYRQLVPANLDFDGGAKVYRPTPEFRPLFEHPAHRALTALSRGFGDLDGGVGAPLVRCEFPTSISRPRVDVLAPVTRALNLQKPLKLTYLSRSSGLSDREVVPLGLVDTGVRWHLRGFDRQTASFRDFVLTRISRAEVIDDVVGAHETADHDVQWSRVINLELVPHPSVDRPDVVEADYEMTNGSLRLAARAANAGYMLRLWSVDCSPDHRLRGPEYMLWLKDPLVLYGADSALLAPGYQAPRT